MYMPILVLLSTFEVFLWYLTLPKPTKRGATEEQVETLATYQEMGTLIKSLHRKPPQRDDYHQLSRKEQVIIFRLRTGHCRLNKHMHDRFKVGESSRCPCGGDQTVEHVLQHCSKHANLRFQTWPLGASLAEKLEESLEALRKTTGFIEKSGLIVWWRTRRRRRRAVICNGLLISLLEIKLHRF